MNILSKSFIIVNATALRHSGAFTILKQFVDAIPDDGFYYLLFVNSCVKINIVSTNIIFVPIEAKSFFSRFIWDSLGVKKYLKRHNIKPEATLSLQNTNFRTNSKIPNYIYYHQPIPFFNNNWNLLNSSERPLWFYKNIYPFFIKIFINRNTEIFVQTKFTKDGFSNYFQFASDKIHVIKPKVNLAPCEDKIHISLDHDRFNIFYPATPFKYKNHFCLIKALSLLNLNIQRNITLHLTCTREELSKYLPNNKFYFTINFLGNIAFAQVLSIYKESDTLAFPSYIETFGLPLLEAASFGLPIIAADMPYAREVLYGYSGASFVQFDNFKEWSERILERYINKGEKFPLIRIDHSDSWEKMFQILKSKILQNV